MNYFLKVVVLLIISLFPSYSHCKIYFSATEPIGNWLNIKVFGPSEVKPNEFNEFEIEISPVEYKSNAQKYKWVSESWTVGDPNVQISLLAPSNVEIEQHNGNYEARVAEYGKLQPSNWVKISGQKTAPIWTKVGVGKIMDAFLKGSSKTVQTGLFFASAAESIADDDKKFQALKKYSGKNYSKYVIPIGTPGKDICAVKTKFKFKAFNGNNSETIGLLIKADKRSIFGQYDVNYYLIEFPILVIDNSPSSKGVHVNPVIFDLEKIKVEEMAVSSNGKFILTCDDVNLRVWSTKDTKQTKTITTDFPIWLIDLSKNNDKVLMYCAGFKDGKLGNELIMIDLSTSAVLKRININENFRIRSIKLSPDGKLAAVIADAPYKDISEHRTISILDIINGRRIYLHKEPVVHICFISNNIILIATKAGIVKLFDIEQKSIIKEMKGIDADDIEYYPDHNAIMFRNGDLISLWDKTLDQKRWETNLQDNSIHTSHSPSKNIFLIKDLFAYVLNADNGNIIFRIVSLKDRSSISNNKFHAYKIGENMFLYDLEIYRQAKFIKSPVIRSYFFKSIPNSPYFIIGGKTNLSKASEGVYIVDNNGKVIKEINIEYSKMDKIKRLVFSSDGRYCLFGSYKDIMVMDLNLNSKVVSFAIANFQEKAFFSTPPSALSSNGQMVAFIDSGILKVYDIKMEKMIYLDKITVTSTEQIPLSGWPLVAFSPDNDKLLIGGNKVIIVADFYSGKLVRHFEFPTKYALITNFNIISNSKYLVGTYHSPASIKIWDFNSGELITEKYYFEEFGPIQSLKRMFQRQKRLFI